MSDISQVFEVDDILTLSEDITAYDRWGLGEKNGYPFLCSEFNLLIVTCNFEAKDFLMITITILKNGGIPVS